MRRVTFAIFDISPRMVNNSGGTATLSPRAPQSVRRRAKCSNACGRRCGLRRRRVGLIGQRSERWTFGTETREASPSPETDGPSRRRRSRGRLARGSERRVFGTPQAPTESTSESAIGSPRDRRGSAAVRRPEDGPGEVLRERRESG